MPRLLPACYFAATALTAVGCMVNVDRQGYIEREEKRFEVTEATDLRLYTFDGSIEIRTWDRPDALVEIEKRGQDKDAVSKIQVLVDKAGGRIQIEARHPGSSGVFVGIGSYTSPSAKFIVSVPRRISVMARTGDGAIVVERIDGRLELRTDDGTIRATETSGELVAETGDGSITLDEVAGRIEVRTDDGSLRITGTPTVLRARSGDGTIVLRIRRGAKMTEDWMVATSDGSISAELPDDFNATIEADPGSDGRARSELALTSVSGGTHDARTLRGVLGAGGKNFVLRTGDGTIRLTKF